MRLAFTCLAVMMCIAVVPVPSSASEQKPRKTPSGATVTILREGSDGMPRPTDQAKVHYEGKLADGTVFDSSYKRGEPVLVSSDNVIRCWAESVWDIEIGSKINLVCPPETAYGDRAVGNVIPPNATLTFTVELLDSVSR